MEHYSKKLEYYISEHTESENDVLKELYRQTHLKIYHPRQLSGHLQGKSLEMFVHMIKPKNILEIGTFTGYSAICMALALEENAHIHTIEVNDELEDFIRHYIKKSGTDEKIKLHIGSAQKIIPTLSVEFDLVFMDAEKNEYIDYFEIILPKVKKGGFILADNVLWSGKVIQEDIASNDYFTKGILNFNEYVHNDKRVQNVLLPIRDGIMVLRKI